MRAGRIGGETLVGSGIGEIPSVSRRYFPRFLWSTRAAARYGGCGYPIHITLVHAYTRMERRDRFIPLRSTCTVKMQSRLARQRIHQHTRAHTRQPRRPAVVRAVATELGRGGGRLPPCRHFAINLPLPRYYRQKPIF